MGLYRIFQRYRKKSVNIIYMTGRTRQVQISIGLLHSRHFDTADWFILTWPTYSQTAPACAFEW